MNIQITGKNLPVTDALREIVQKKLKKLDRYFESDTEVTVVLSIERERQIIEVTIPLGGVILRGEESTDDMYTSVEGVVRKLEKQITHHRTRLERRLKGDAFHGMSGMPEDAEEEGPHIVVRTKRFAVKPLDLDEATLQMQLLGHDFFVFMNADSGEVNVLYKRKDGNFGLIEPQYDE